tara:strand:+ start:332 stop:1516 length:1185 start_codon:yes stop_codon:yes gene_type:complete
VKKRAYHFEIKNLLTQFIAAFDDVVISRYNKSRVAKQNIDVRYVFAPKQRVMYDIINKAQNLTLPVVAVDLTSVTRDDTRVFNKIVPSYLPTQLLEAPKASSKFLMPVPVNLEINMSILARYMQDVDQIVSNFVPYNNPYIILSWQVPEDFGTEYTQEIRSEVLWSGNLDYNTPTETTYSDKFRITVDTSFTIKGWLFPEQKDTSATIYKVDNNFINVDLANKIYSPLDKTTVIGDNTYQEYGYGVLSAFNTESSGLTSNTETITISAIPEFTNIFYVITGQSIMLTESTTIKKDRINWFTLYGKRFNYSNNFYLSSNVADFRSNYTAITSAKSDTISGYKLDDSLFNVVNDNVVSIYLPASTLSATGDITFITGNEAGWGTSYQASSSIITVA